ncbi:hypothetical protein ACH4GP_29680 [Streptomyces celluloflavus]|uniref:Uncharacterized protein n=1 Tax=Streptomyces celluloflavus TaxID=58344 RepID=A0ABW7RKB7_9ACTN
MSWFFGVFAGQEGKSFGFTSARAESTPRQPTCRTAATVHLRLRGEHDGSKEIHQVSSFSLSLDTSGVMELGTISAKGDG